ncbi:MAG: hypothetical protein E6J45_10095 [Chloroflexi bacterium]|nr:MAG: hypothetical protein E6J45_10095 [Chloroflexota bacterium]
MRHRGNVGDHRHELRHRGPRRIEQGARRRGIARAAARPRAGAGRRPQAAASRRGRRPLRHRRDRPRPRRPRQPQPVRAVLGRRVAGISAASYDNQLDNAPEVQAYDYVTRKPFPVALHFVDTEGMRGGRERRGPGGALRNEAEVRVAAQVVRLLDERCPRELSMAVIAMYAEQVERLRQALGRRRFKRTVKIDTVDSFEGREEDIVVISLVRSNERGRIGFLRVPNRLNVAISRAKHLVACIGDSATLRSGEESMYGTLVEASRRTGGWLSALELVQPVKHGRGRPQQLGEGEPGEGAASDGDEGRKRRRRRRRRGRRGGGIQQGAAASGDTAAPVATPVDGETAAPGSPGAPVSEGGARRRRRRRRRGRGHGRGPMSQQEAPADGSPSGGTADVRVTLPGENLSGTVLGAGPEPGDG